MAAAAAKWCLALVLAVSGLALPTQPGFAADGARIAAAAEGPDNIKRRLAEECQTRCEHDYQRCLIQFGSDWSRCQQVRTVCHSGCPYKAGSPRPR